MNNNLNQKVLLLNQSYQPLMTLGAKRAIILSFTEKVEVLEQLVTLLTDCANRKMRINQIEEFIDNLY